MTSALTALAIAVGLTSLVCYALMTRLQNRRANRSTSSDGSGLDGGNLAGSDSLSVASWFVGHRSGLDSSGNPSDAGWGGGDGGEAATAAAAINAGRPYGKMRPFDRPQIGF
jgi:hypothetical protein